LKGMIAFLLSPPHNGYWLHSAIVLGALKMTISPMCDISPYRNYHKILDGLPSTTVIITIASSLFDGRPRSGGR